jgi:hypothetical protein
VLDAATAREGPPVDAKAPAGEEPATGRATA